MSSAAQPAQQSPDLVRHMIGCQPCDGHLTELKSAPDVLDHLVHGGRADDEAVRLESALSVAGKQGELELQRLLYELGRSSLALIPEYRDGRQLDGLVPVEVVSHRIDSMIPRAKGRCAGELSNAAKAFRVEKARDPARPAELALHLGQVLDRTQEKPSFGRFLIGDASHHLGDYSQARQSFATVYEHGVSAAFRSAAANGVMFALIANRQFAAALEFADSCDDGLREQPAYWLNRATAHASVGASTAAHDALLHLKALHTGDSQFGKPDAWWDDQAVFFANHLDCTVDEARFLLPR